MDALIKEFFTYDAHSGVITWVKNRGGRGVAGRPAGALRPDGYIKIRLDNKQLMAHRLAWFLYTGAWPKANIDHINGQRADNRIVNLREATARMNNENLRKANARNKLGILGVVARGNRFAAFIMSHRKQHYLGLFDSESAAHQAYVEAKRKLHAGGVL